VKTKAIGVVIMLGLAGLSGAQDHAPIRRGPVADPTVDECLAHAAMWGQLPIPNDGDDLSFRTLRGRVDEMLACRKVDPANERNYFNVSGNFYTVIGLRFNHFLVRHDLTALFVEEDDAGLR
jgi:hypothetical protein